jgi:AcrR family transcriptional regulator
MSMPDAEPGEQSPAADPVARGPERRDAIVEAALDMFGTRGYHGTSVRAVAERCGVSHQSLMYYFPTKEALLEAALRRRDQFLSSHFSSPDGLDPRALIQLAGVNRAQPGHVEIFTSAAADATATDHPAHNYYQEFYTELVRALARYLEIEFSTGVRTPLAGMDALGTARAILALQDGLQLQWLYDRNHDVARTMMTVLDAIAPPSRPSQ